MRHAILITAYQNLVFMNHLLNYFDSDFDFYIHIDRKCKENHSFLLRDKRVKLYKKYRIEWGGSNHISAIVDLMTEANKVGNYDFYHLITGSDLPVKPLSYFKMYFKLKKGQNFMHYFPLPTPPELWGPEGGLDRINYYYLTCNFVDKRKNRNIFVIADRKLREIYKRTLKKRPFNHFKQLYGGSTYWSLARDSVRYAVDFFQSNPDYLKRFMYTTIGEEIFLQTLLLNNERIRIQNNYLRYMRWDKWGTKPETLDETDYIYLENENILFARKFDDKVSKSLMIKLGFQVNKK